MFDEEVSLMVVKVVVNRKYGGFGLSAAAMALGAERSGNPRWGLGEFDELVVDRHDPVLVAVVEELGTAADGPSARLAVEELRLGYSIEDRDGKETVRPL